MARLTASAGGFSATEMATVLAISTLMTTVAAPSMHHYISLAQQVRAQHDVRTLSVSVLRLEFDLGTFAQHGLDEYALLVGDGRAPALAPGVDPIWSRPVDGRRVGTLAAHLLLNRWPYHPTIETGRGWRGPYLDGSSIHPDPWGNRYGINVGSIHIRRAAVIVLSAGPNGLIETRSDDNPNGASNGDDVFALIAMPQVVHADTAVPQ